MGGRGSRGRPLTATKTGAAGAGQGPATPPTAQARLSDVLAGRTPPPDDLQDLADLIQVADGTQQYQLSRIVGSPAFWAAVEAGHDRDHPPVAVPAELPGRIREAWNALTDPTNPWVSLARLRPLLGNDYSRDAVDEALRQMRHQQGVSLIPETLRHLMTQPERDAAVEIGGADYHVITFDRAPHPPGEPTTPPVTKEHP